MALWNRHLIIVQLLSQLLALAHVSEIDRSPNKLTIRLGSGEAIELSETGLDTSSARISPDRRKIAYHKKYLYPPTPRTPLEVRLWTTEAERRLHELNIPFPSPYVEQFEWLDSRYILASGSSRAVIVDTEAGGVTHALWAKRVGGDLFFVSPDRQKIFYARGVPRTLLPEGMSDVAVLAALGKGVPATTEPLALEAGVHRLYPRDGKGIGAAMLALRPVDRHLFKSGFLWFSDSARVVFVEQNEGNLWLVILGLLGGDAMGLASSTRIRLNVPAGAIEAFKWQTADKELLVRIDGNEIVVPVPLGTE